MRKLIFLLVVLVLLYVPVGCLVRRAGPAVQRPRTQHTADRQPCQPKPNLRRAASFATSATKHPLRHRNDSNRAEPVGNFSSLCRPVKHTIDLNNDGIEEADV